MTELQVLRWYENPEASDCDEDDIPLCKWCKQLEGECECIDDWKLED